MPLPRQEVDATTPKYLRDKYAIVGVGETTYTRGSGKTTRAMGTWAVRNAMLDAGLKASDIDGMLSYSGNDSTPSPFLAGDLGISEITVKVHRGQVMRKMKASSVPDLARMADKLRLLGVL